jgi:hypothetical protein
MKTFYVENFLSDALYEYVITEKYKNEVELSNDFFDQEGVFKGAQTSTQEWLDKNSFFVKELKKHLNTVEYIRNHHIDGIQIMKSIRPYDIHSDWVVTNNQQPLVDVEKFPPSYTVIIPLVSGDYHTIVFDQGAKYNNLVEFKKNNSVLNYHCSNEDWDRYLSHCHKEDQQYVSIREIYKWNKGDLFGFDRKLFHSASHHHTPKQGIVIWMSFPND